MEAAGASKAEKKARDYRAGTGHAA